MGSEVSVLVNHLLCQEIIFRAILKPGWIDDNGNINANAFIRDSARHPDGLFVNMKSNTDVECWPANFNKSLGVDSLHTGRVRNLKLEIGQKLEDLSSGGGHALIVGLPSVDEDPKMVEDLATQLVKMSRNLDRKTRVKAKAQR